MSNYIARSVLKKVDDSKPWWQETYAPGDNVPVSGIYICVGCNREIASNKDDPFPPQNHHQHSSAQGRIRWRLNIRANTTGVL